MQKFLFILLLSIILSSCSIFPSQAEQLYMENQNGEKLMVPNPPLTDEHLSAFYVLPIETENPRVSTLPPVTG